MKLRYGLSNRMALFMTQSYQKAGGIPAVAEMQTFPIALRNATFWMVSLENAPNLLKKFVG